MTEIVRAGAITAVCPGWPKGAHELRCLFPDGTLGGIWRQGGELSHGCCVECRARIAAEAANWRVDSAAITGMEG
jgi:hypothetical protein